MNIIAHRGYAALYPENTVAAVRAASAGTAGDGRVPPADLIEIDVRRCATGEIVVYHDEGLEKLTGYEGLVAETPLSTLRTLTILDSEESIPLLEEVLDAADPETPLVVELKHAGMAREVAAACEAAENDAVLSSFFEGVLRECASVSALPRALVFDSDWDASLSTARELGCNYVNAEYHLLLGHEERISAAQDAGFEVNAWHVTDADAASRLRRHGIDGIVVDDPTGLDL
ncbi:glycerophosphoryl diester phosphodiesterase [Halopelagius inordinatus]|uniref:Glycerophosphoryl diester phosphodiesterase n=1 Tax=Halopelagius inordinatus TaxID=553467 RepID=A0A1I2RNH6_9EURY|nr:glycerophosphodiester phosphodiesterase [Halopelagius inordinatus]SFG42255.1 glycerophosphoryl diester phosphodiesterase [Halopelagius inordinatus]